MSAKEKRKLEVSEGQAKKDVVTKEAKEEVVITGSCDQTEDQVTKDIVEVPKEGMVYG
jgi:hypothetical protein